MDTEQTGVLVLIGLLALLFFWRVVLTLLVIGLALLVLGKIWTTPGYATESRLVASALVVALAYWLVPNPKSAGVTPAKDSGESPRYYHVCGRCNNSGRVSCSWCIGGQAPGSQLHSLGPAKDCFNCAGTGWVKCGCGN